MSDELAESTVSTAQAARELGVSPDWVRHLCDVGTLPSIRVGNGWRLIPKAAVKRLAEQRKREPATA